jgi:hypothetical protein
MTKSGKPGKYVIYANGKAAIEEDMPIANLSK